MQSEGSAKRREKHDFNVSGTRVRMQREGVRMELPKYKIYCLACPDGNQDRPDASHKNSEFWKITY